MLRQLDHPAIIRISECGYVDAASKSRPYIVMDYFQGQTLQGYVKEHGSLKVEDLLAVARNVAAGLQAAHGAKILHRDVKPANLLVQMGTTGWKVKIIDFGLAMPQKVVITSQKASTAKQKETMIGSSIAGTLDYGAPEQMGRRKEPVGPYSDVYGWAKTCCYALFQTAQPLLKHWQRIPLPLAQLLERCLEEDPKDRPQDFREILSILDSFAVGFPSRKVVRQPDRAGEEGQQDYSFRDDPVEPSLSSGRGKMRPAHYPRLRWLLAGAVGLVVLALLSLGVLIGVLMLRSRWESVEVAGKNERPGGESKSAFPAEKTKQPEKTLPIEFPKKTLPIEFPKMEKSESRQFRFTDEKEINTDWNLGTGTPQWRIEGEGLRLSDQNAVLASRFSEKGDLELTINYDMTPNCEMWVKIWDECFQFKGEGNKIGTLRRIGDTVTYGSGSGPPTTVKLKIAQQSKITPIIIHLDRRNLWRPKMELLVRSITVKAAS